MWRYSLPAIIWTAVVTLLCLLPGKDLPEVHVVNFDKFSHLSVFGLLSWLYLRWYSKLSGQSLLLKIMIVLSVALYGGFMELLQGAFYTDRSADWYDVAANCTGCLLAFLLRLRN